MDYYRLEYNELQGIFRYEPISKRNDERFGWDTISMVINLEDIKSFLEIINQEFPNIKNKVDGNFPTAIEIKNRFSSFSRISEL